MGPLTWEGASPAPLEGFSQERRAKGSCCVGLQLGSSCPSRVAVTSAVTLRSHCGHVAVTLLGLGFGVAWPGFGMAWPEFAVAWPGFGMA